MMRNPSAREDDIGTATNQVEQLALTSQLWFENLTPAPSPSSVHVHTCTPHPRRKRLQNAHAHTHALDKDGVPCDALATQHALTPRPQAALPLVAVLSGLVRMQQL
ncbi:hypothetical protein AZE42_13103 [Rhizopogon vesiculosus]|uniref:Uncharacterized protein n=1 Tax=Rhizopogon vesiculosus TaxID=180088 RepID=A0A1J8Q1X3_9AGAM|nr:hypothetical protein AZE42_13103 [Rhizopogon vesiculosus]